MNAGRFTKLRKFASIVSYFAASVLVIGLLAATPYGGVNAQSGDAAGSWIRLVPGAEPWQGELQTAVTRYQNEDGVVIDLVAAVHIADAQYYAGLNDYFATRDSVLYEMVADADDRPSPDAVSSGNSAFGFIQSALARFLDVSFQLEKIDYSADNFRHADLSPGQLQEIMRSKGENFFSMFLGLALAQMASEQQRDTDNRAMSSLNLLTLLTALAADDQSSAFKYLFAEELSYAGGIVLDSELEQQITLLGERNRVAVEVLVETLKEPDQRAISIFYGVAHMAGIEREVVNSLGFERMNQRWLTAWEIP